MNSKKTILFVADVKNWAFDNIAQYLCTILKDDYNIEVLYTEEFKNPQKFLDKVLSFNQVDFIHFFYRGYLKQLLEYVIKKQLDEQKLNKFLSIATTTSIPDHLFINDQNNILEYVTTLSFCDNYYTTSKILHDIYNNIPLYPAPWRQVIFDNVLIELNNPNFTNNDKLVVTWIGNSAWGEWHFKKSYDPKGFHSVIVPTFEELAKKNEIEYCIADGNQKKRSKAEIFDILQKTDILLIAATTDGTPLPLIEAMASGCAVITTHNGIAPEILPEISQQFIIRKDPQEFINSIRRLNEDRSLLSKLKQQNFETFQNIFCNENKFKKLWSSLIEDSISRLKNENRVEIKKKNLTISASLVKSLSLTQFLLRNNLLKRAAKYLLGFKLLKTIISFFYIMLNSKAIKNNFKNFKSTLDLYDFAYSIKNKKNDHIYALYPSMFPGVANSTTGLFDKSIPVPSFGPLEYISISDKMLNEMASAILGSSVKILIISGGSRLMFDLVQKLHAIKGSRYLTIYFLWHGSSAQWSDEHHLEHFYKAYNLYKENKIKAIITLKKDLEKILEKHNIRSFLLQNFIPFYKGNFYRNLPPNKFKIGIWSAYASWVKNLHPQILAVSMIHEQCVLHTNFKFSKLDSWTIENLEIKKMNGQLPHEELINAMANTDITLYVTNTECSPMIALESLSLGIPCLVGPTSSLFDDDEVLREYLTVNRVDCPVTISLALQRLFKNYQLVKERLPNFIDKYNKKAGSLREKLYDFILFRKEEEIFTNIYANNLWTNGSGPGSNKDHTVEYRKLLQEYFNDSRFSSFIDLGCGDWQIMSLIEIPEGKTYKGYDIVQSVINNNKANFERNNVHFCQNTDFHHLARGDLLIIKDVMIHWSNDKVIEFIKDILPKFKYALITNDYTDELNSLNIDIDTGQFRCIDITKPPFNLHNAEQVLEYVSHGKIKKSYLYKNPNF